MIQIPQLQKELSARRLALALQVDIEDMAAYAIEWKKLAAEFDSAGWIANAEICHSNAERYGRYDVGAYQRRLEEIPVRLEPMPQWSDPEERTLYCQVEGTWTKHVRLTDGWMCSCGTFVGSGER